MIIIFMCGIVFTIFGVFSIYKDRQFKKYGVPVKLKVKDIKIQKKENGTRAHYITTFEFEFDGKIREETIPTFKKFKIGSNKKGVFLNKGENNKLSVSGEGFWLAPGAGFVIIIFGLVCIWVSLTEMLGFSNYVVLTPFVIFAILLFFYITIYPKIMQKFKKSKNKSKQKVKELYYNDIEDDEYSSVPMSMVRYIPKIKKDNQNEKFSIAIVFLCFIFAFAGLITIYMGIIGARELIDIKTNWTLTNATVKDFYTYTTRESNGDKVERQGTIYEYKVDGIKYELDKKESTSFAKYKKGDDVKLYYNSKKPNNAELKDGLFTRIMPITLGLLFSYVTIFIFIDEKKRVRLYKEVLLKKGEK